MPGPPEPRRHHYVPKFLLAGFTPTGNIGDSLWVHDTGEHHQPRAQRPDQIAYRRDFYRVDVADTDPFWVEKALGEIESMTAPIIREIDRTWKLPDGENLKTLLRFIALLASRVPSQRENFSDFMDQLFRLSAEILTATPERYARQISALRAKGHEVEDLDYQDVRDLLKPGAVQFNVDRTWLVGRALEGAETILDCLVDRNWGLMIAGRDMPNFVCSDNPVSLVSTVPLPSLVGPGFGMAHTMVLARLTRRIVLLGMFEPVPPLVPLDRPHSIALINSWAVAYASRWVFSPQADFVWLKPDGKVGNASDVRRIVESRRTEGPGASMAAPSG